MIKFTQVHIVLYFAKTWLFSRIWAKCPLQHNWNSHFTRYCFQLLNVLAVLSFDAVFFFLFYSGNGINRGIVSTSAFSQGSCFFSIFLSWTPAYVYICAHVNVLAYMHVCVYICLCLRPSCYMCMLEFNACSVSTTVN